MRQVLFYLSLTGFISCVSIHPSTVRLSAEIGQRISEMEKLHQIAIQRYFDAEKAKVDDFLTVTWEPLFLKNFLGTSKVLSMLQNASKIDDKGKAELQEAISQYLSDKSEAPKATTELVQQLNSSREGENGLVRTTLSKFVEDKDLDAAVIHISSLLGTDEPALIIFEFTEAAHKQMDAERKELIAPIDKAQQEATASLSEAYAELIRGQSTITGRLQAASKVTAQQDDLLGSLGLGKISKDVTERLAEVSAKVNSGLLAASSLIQKTDKSNNNEIINILKSSLNSIGTISQPAHK